MKRPAGSCFKRILLILLILLPMGLKAQVNGDVDESKIDAIFKEWDSADSPGCAVGIYQDGEIIFSKGYGEADLEAGIPITPQTVFYAGSVSKQFTAAAIALLSLKGKVDMERPVKDYIPEMPDYAGYPDPTVEQLVHHTSGIPDLYSLLALYDISLEKPFSFDEMVALITGQSHLNFEPGSQYMYSNSGYTLLAELIERVSGQTLREYTTDHIFKPLGMNHTHFHDNRNDVIENRALSYQPGMEESFRLSYLKNFEGVGPGGLYTTVEDMLKWDQQFYENRLPGADEFHEKMLERGVLNDGEVLTYAFALEVNTYKGMDFVGHSGSFMGFKAHYFRLPEYHYGSATLCNLGNINPTNLNRKIADVFFDDVFVDWQKTLTGTYVSDELNLEYNLSMKDDHLFLDRKNSPAGKLEYSNGTTFLVDGWEVIFDINANGEAEGFSISSGRATGIFFEKK